ncbi:MAG: cytochrome b/b6 domain-containing protein [Rhodobacteraceae bacterium]|nr:cytochrome b/b6 domain-containing protein [Paracoccaceae bacterium]
MSEMSADDAACVAGGPVQQVRVWDPLIRVFHWGLVATFAVAFLSAEELDSVHELAGYIAAGLVAFRLIWGLIGGRYARFAQFLRGPSETVGYIGDMARGRERRHLGHNPAGAAMIVALLVTLTGTAFTGWMMADPDRVAMLPDLPQIVSPAYADGPGEHGEGGAGAVKEVHEVLANLVLVLIALHVGGVVLASVRHDENLARAMLTGHKRAPAPDDIA